MGANQRLSLTVMDLAKGAGAVAAMKLSGNFILQMISSETE
jgi:hypothetical protein